MTIKCHLKTIYGRTVCGISEMDGKWVEKNPRELTTIPADQCCANCLRTAIRWVRNGYACAKETLSEEIARLGEIRKANGFESIWSLSGRDVLDFSQPHPFTDAATVTHELHWGDEPVVQAIRGNTWMDLWRAAEAAIRVSQDLHHVFIEAFEVRGDTLVLQCGS